jgi:abortive infection bacteriophage resistance protein
MSNRFCEKCIICYDDAIDAENMSRHYYQRLSDYFERESGVSDVFKVMSQDLSDYAHTLEEIRNDGVHSPRIHDLADELSNKLSKLWARIGSSIQTTPRNLDEAWCLACDLERSAIHEVYLQLTAELSNTNGPAGNFIARHVETHIQRLRELGKRYDATRRKSILPTLHRIG